MVVLVEGYKLRGRSVFVHLRRTESCRVRTLITIENPNSRPLLVPALGTSHYEYHQAPFGTHTR